MPKKFWVGLIVILLIYTLYYFVFVESSYVHDMVPRKLRHLIKFTILIAVYMIGLYHLSLDNVIWMKTIWHIVHLLGIFMLVSFGLYDWIIKVLPLSTKLFLISINELLIAPTLYIVMGILNKFLLKNEIGSK